MGAVQIIDSPRDLTTISFGLGYFSPALVTLCALSTATTVFVPTESRGEKKQL